MPWRAWLLVLLLGLVGIPLVLGGLLCWAAPGNSLHLRRLSHQYAALAHPPDSTIIQAYRAVGVLDGAGNHCDFIAGEQRQSSRSPEAIQAFYADRAEVSVYHPGLPESEANYAPSHVRYSTPGGWPAGSYAVFLYDGSNDPRGDLRCN